MRLGKLLSMFLLLLGVFMVSTFYTTKVEASVGNIFISTGDLQQTKNAMKTIKEKKYETEDGIVLTGDKIIYVDKANSLVFEVGVFEGLSTKSQRNFLTDLTRTLNSVNILNKTRRDIEATIYNNSPTASRLDIPMSIEEAAVDLSGGYGLLGNAPQYIKIFFGLLVYVIIYLLIASTILDFMYIGLPMTRLQGDKKPVWITMDAYSAVREIEGGDFKKNVYFNYVKRRSWTYILLILALTWLVIGNMGDLYSAILTLGDGVF